MEDGGGEGGGGGGEGGGGGAFDHRPAPEKRLEGGGAYGEAVGMAYAGVAVAPSSSALANEKRGRSVAEPPTVCP